jgi:hypothetical protein
MVEVTVCLVVVSVGCESSTFAIDYSTAYWFTVTGETDYG